MALQDVLRKLNHLPGALGKNASETAVGTVFSMQLDMDGGLRMVTESFRQQYHCQICQDSGCILDSNYAIYNIYNIYINLLSLNMSTQFL